MQAIPKMVQTANTTPPNVRLPRYDLNLRLTTRIVEKRQLLTLHIDYRTGDPEYADDSSCIVNYLVDAEQFGVMIRDCEQGWRSFLSAIIEPNVNPTALTKLVQILLDRGRDLHTTLLKGEGATNREGEVILSRLRKFLAEQPDGLRILIEDSLNVPWNLILLEKNAGHRGFLGYKHQLVNKIAINSDSLDHAPLEDFCAAPPFQLSLQRNRTLAHYMDVSETSNGNSKRDARPFEAFINQFRSHVNTPQRDSKTEFLSALQNAASRDDFMYFICHGNFDKDKRYYLQLSDNTESIYAVEIAGGFEDGHLLRQPLIFLNACFGARTGTIPYADFARTFLDHGASAVIGPILEVPANAAVKIVKSFFQELFCGDKQAVGTNLPATIADVLYFTRRHLMDQEPGPDLIPLLYSVSIRRRFHFRWQMKLSADSTELSLRTPWEEKRA